jgi:hypothetical protein
VAVVVVVVVVVVVGGGGSALHETGNSCGIEYVRKMLPECEDQRRVCGIEYVCGDSRQQRRRPNFSSFPRSSPVHFTPELSPSPHTRSRAPTLRHAIRALLSILL